MRASLLLSTLTAIIAFFFTQYLDAQITPNWSLTGNSNAKTYSKLGTTNAIPLSLFTNNIVRVHINTLGNVGIGTSTPAQKLHVSGNTFISGSLGVGTYKQNSKLVVNSIINESPFSVQIDDKNKLYVSANGGLSIGGGSAPPANGLNVVGSIGVGIIKPVQKLHVEGNTYISGNIGIGTPTPSYKLEVQGSSFISGNSLVFGMLGIGTATPVQKLHVEGNTYITGNVGIGTPKPTQKLQVEGNAIISGNSLVFGMLGIGTATPVQKLHVEGNTYITGNVGIGTSNPSYKLDVQGGSTVAIAGVSNSTGVYGKGGPIGIYGSGSTYGVYAGSTSGYGAYFYSAQGTGLYASTGRGDKAYAAAFSGNVYANGVYTSSDKTLKKNVEDLDEALSLILQLKPRHYEFQQDGRYAALHLPRGRHYGLLAQELEEVLPGLVKEAPLPVMEPPAEPGAAAEETSAVAREQTNESMTVKAVNYTELIPILIKAVQEQDQKIEQQQQQINELKDLVSRLSKGERISTTLSDAELLQNIPNPVKGSTSISYRLPEGAGRAQLVVADALGRTIKTLPLNKSGMVHFNVSGLSSGLYTYSLVIDKKVVQTKKMTVER